jgi:hypothetical protein
MLYLGDVPHHHVNTNEAMEHSRMANGRAETATDTDSEGHCYELTLCYKFNNFSSLIDFLHVEIAGEEKCIRRKNIGKSLQKLS